MSSQREDLLKHYMNKDYIKQHLNHYVEFIQEESQPYL